MHEPIPSEYRGWWRITETSQWVDDGLDILGPALLSLTGHGARLRMHCLLAYVNCKPTKTGISFTWEYDQMSLARLQTGDVAGGGPAKVDRLLDEGAAQSKPQQRATWPSGTRALHAAKLGAVAAHLASALGGSGAGPCSVRTSRFVS